MHLFNFFFLATAIAGPLTRRQDTLPNDDDSGPHGVLTIINATPYTWLRSRAHSYLVDGWDDAFPESFAPGQVVTQTFGYMQSYDTGADLTYNIIEPSDSAKGFNIHLTGKHGGYSMEATNFGGLVTSGHGSDGTPYRFYDFADIKPQGDEGQAVYVLASNGGGYTSVEPDIAWMADLGPKFKELKLKQITLPLAHDSGMWTVGAGNGLGTPENTQTQNTNVYGQLQRGARVLNWRPYINGLGDRAFRFGHFTDNLGAFGGFLHEGVDQVNQFNKDYPGELIIIELTPGFQIQNGVDHVGFSESDWSALLGELEGGLQGTVFFDLTGGGDLANEPLSTFYAKSQSPVLIRVDAGSIPDSLKDSFKSGNDKITAIFSSDRLSEEGDYSNTNDLDHMRSDQRDKLSKRSKDKVFVSSYTLTQNAADIVGGESIEDFALYATGAFYTDVWPLCAKGTCPNQVVLDYYKDHQNVALIKAMNLKFAMA